jgi:hypothetical protein
VSALYHLAERATAGLIDTEDVDEVGGQLDPNTTAVTLLVEHVWMRELSRAVTSAGGVVVASVQVLAPYAAEAEQALAAESEQS